MNKGLFKHWTTEKLRKRSKLCLALAIILLLLMCLTLGMALYKISQGEEATLIALSVPVVLAPMTFIPILASTLMTSELRRRKKG